MLNRIDNVNEQEVFKYIILGIIICCITVFIIKMVADYVWRTGKILYKRYLIPMLVVMIPIFFYKEIETYMKIDVPFKVFKIIASIIMLIILLSLIIKLGLIRGLCMFIIQIVGAVLCVSAIYASIVLMIFIVAVVVGGAWLMEGKFITMIAIDDGEIVYVRSKQKYYVDQEGKLYLRSGDYVYRMDDNKIFMFY